jgi:hypothetical protein
MHNRWFAHTIPSPNLKQPKEIMVSRDSQQFGHQVSWVPINIGEIGLEKNHHEMYDSVWSCIFLVYLYNKTP